MTSNPLMDHITKENVLQAIERIDTEGIPSRRSSDSYDLVYNNIAYPPKYIISLAGYFSNTGKFIFGSKFKGGENTDCFELLRGLGFKIIPKTETKNLKTPNFAGDLHFKYAYLVLDETINNQRFEKSFQEYVSYCKRSHWIDRNEAYKFRFGRWISERIDFDKQSDQEILDLFIRSQDNEYSEQFKGVNFIISAKRHNDHFIIKKDIETLRKLFKGGLLEDEDLKNSPLSPTKLGIWAGCLIPDKYSILANGTLFSGLQYLFNFPADIPKKKVRHFNICNAALNEIKSLVKTKFQNEAQEICSMIFENSPITPVDYTWLVQDYILYLKRKKISPEKNYFWVFQGDNYKVEKEHGIVAAPVGKLHHHKRLCEMNEGDIVIHYANSAIRAVSEVKREYTIANKPYLRDVQENYIVSVDYKELEKPISMQTIKERFTGKESLLPKKYGPLSKNLGPVQMYMCEFNKESHHTLFELPNYWVFQGRPEIFDAARAIQEDNLHSWSVHAHKEKIKIGDRIILWLTGKNSGCYALAEVSSELYHSSESSNERLYYKKDPGEATSDKVHIKITNDLTRTFISKETLEELPEFIDFNGGNQGTNFTATKRQYEIILNMIEDKEPKNYWLYQPGEDADGWSECLEKKLMTIGWHDLGDISRFKDKEAIREKLQELENTDGNKMNDTKANEDFLRTMEIGDVVIVKKGISVLLGYGYIESDYFYDDTALRYQKRRKMTWKKTGEWPAGHEMAQKTLTNITEFQSEELSPGKTYYQALIDIMNGNEINQKAEKSSRHPINAILFGPPGTGKTYDLKKTYFPKYTSKETSITKEKYFESVVKDCTWFEVITIALLEIGEKAKVDSILKNKWITKKAELSKSSTVRPTLWGQLQTHTIDNCDFVNYKNRRSPQIFNKTKDSFWEIIHEELEEQAPEIKEITEKVNNYTPRTDKEIKRYKFTTFHQSFGYEDFIEGIKPVMNEISQENSEVKYQIEPGIFKQICDDAESDPENKYAIFIDEINRGNVSSIFGELITLIEHDKRKGADNEMKAILPYSKKEFSVPINLDIYGTMNTADRSVEALDTALRRRFSFIEMMPNPKLLKNKKIEGIDLTEVLIKINARIEALIDRDHTIGHSYLFNVKSMGDLKLAFKDKIIPLLQEYFYGDYGKIGLVLGGGFVKMHAQENEIFADFEYDGSDGLAQNKFELIPIDSEFNMEEAIKTLLNNSGE